MIDGNAGAFIDKLSYEDHYVMYKNEKYFFNGCQTKKDNNGNIVYVLLEVYNLTENKTIFSVKKKSMSECIAAFEKAELWDNRSFWEAESEMEWVDC